MADQEKGVPGEQQEKFAKGWLSDRCARLTPGYHAYECSLIIHDLEDGRDCGIGEFSRSTVEDAAWFARDLARHTLTDAQFGTVDAASEQGQELTELIGELDSLAEQAAVRWAAQAGA